VDAALQALRASKKTEKHQPAILIATDGHTVAAEHLRSGDTLHCDYSELGDHFGFFLPAAGKDRYRPAEENPVDIKASGKLAKLYDALLRVNPDWGTGERRHDMNQFMTRLIFCMFAEDVGIFPENQFSEGIFTYGGNKGEHAREAFEYVNGGLFSGNIDVPGFDAIAFRYLREACGLRWVEINPDIFGSMIQSIADPKSRERLGMHYTSVPNIMKALGPLFLDDIDTEIEKAWDRPKTLRRALDRLARLVMLDPACGSGNFLVVAYRELRAREIRILERLSELEGRAQAQMWSSISLSNFYGIELSDFAVETTKLALFVAEQQADRRFADTFGRMPASLPLKGGGRIRCANALRTDWTHVCPPLAEQDTEVVVFGNPPYFGAKKRTQEQIEDIDLVGLGDAQLLDYVSGWIVKAAEHARRGVTIAFVVTSSVCQGEQVVPLWTRIFGRGLHIRFAYRPFKWRNSAADIAGVSVTILGLTSEKLAQCRLYEPGFMTTTNTISPYLIPGPFIPVSGRGSVIADLPAMVMGSNPVDGKRLVVTPEEREAFLAEDPRAERFLQPYLGGDEILYGRERYCVWVDDAGLEEALSIQPIATRIEACRRYRENAGRDARRAADRPHRFCYSTWRNAPVLAVPNTQSEDRLYLPATPLKQGVVLSHAAFAVYDPPPWLLAVLSSAIHRSWLATVGGRLEDRFRYAVTLVYNTFPIPVLTESQTVSLEVSARRILKTRYQHYPKTLADLYDPDKMPDDLREVHRENDALLESMYIGRPFRNDTERLEHLFKLYAARVAKMKKDAA
jgi:hypothetical protein